MRPCLSPNHLRWISSVDLQNLSKALECRPMLVSWKSRELILQIGKNHLYIHLGGRVIFFKKRQGIISLKVTHYNYHRWIFEKYDGIRGFWNPVKKAFFSRKGRQFAFPKEVIDTMPTDLFLDGELWYDNSFPSYVQFCLLSLSKKGLEGIRFRKL